VSKPKPLEEPVMRATFSGMENESGKVVTRKM